MTKPNLLETPTAAEFLSLDDYVSTKKGDLILYVRVRGESMPDVGIETGDLVIVDRLRQAKNGAVVLTRLGTTYTIKKFKEIDVYDEPRLLYLVSADSKYPTRRVKGEDGFKIVGVITHVLKTLGGGK
jgi:SOS-response transcriptional repressor LexA